MAENVKEKLVKFDELKVFAEEIEKKYATQASLPEKVSDLVNDAKYQTESEVTAAINAKVSSTYKAGGSTAFADLPELTEANLGLVVNVTDDFTTTDSFVDGAGNDFPAGTNVAVVLSGDEYKYDVLAGFVNLSSYATSAKVTEDIATAVEQIGNEMDEKLTAYLKTSDFEYVTEEEVRGMFA